jgi:predicted glutamine amidotransferase
MCGIIGCYTTGGYGMSADEMKTFYNLLIADSARGEDGTGFFWKDIDTDKRWFWRNADRAGVGISKSQVLDMIYDARLVVGHNRAATMGNIDDDHTHPFNHGQVLGVHNGTVRGWEKLLPDVKDALMDSDAIIRSLAEADPDPEAVDEVLQKISTGAYALVWHDDRVDELRMVRNDDRPMHIVCTDRAVWFGSEVRMLEWALYRNTEYPRVGFKLDTHTLLSIKVGGEAKVIPMTEPSRVTSGYNTTGYTTYWDKDKDGWPISKDEVAANRFGLGTTPDLDDTIPWYQSQEGLL